MIEHVPMSPTDATMKLMHQFPGSETFEAILEQGSTPEEAALFITSFVATTFTHDLSAGEEIAYLSEWHRGMRDHCSLEYGALRQAHPEATREELNQNPTLQILNGIRRGVRSALVKQLHYAERSNSAQATRMRFAAIIDEGFFADPSSNE